VFLRRNRTRAESPRSTTSPEATANCRESAPGLAVHHGKFRASRTTLKVMARDKIRLLSWKRRNCEGVAKNRWISQYVNSNPDGGPRDEGLGIPLARGEGPGRRNFRASPARTNAGRPTCVRGSSFEELTTLAPHGPPASRRSGRHSLSSPRRVSFGNSPGLLPKKSVRGEENARFSTESKMDQNRRERLEFNSSSALLGFRVLLSVVDFFSDRLFSTCIVRFDFFLIPRRGGSQ